MKKIIFFLKIAQVFGVLKTFEIIIKYLFNKKIISFTIRNNKISLRKNSSDLEVFIGIFCKYNYRSKSLLNLNPNIIVDIGCNNGLSIVNFHTDFPECKIIGIEPDPVNYQFTLINSKDLKNVEVLNSALWHENTKLHLKDNGKGEYAFSLVTNGKIYSEVDTITMTDLMDIYNLNHIDLLKIDIEGAELDIFSKGSLDWISKVNCIVIELHDWIQPGCSEAFFKAIYPFKFSVDKQGECFTVFFYHDK
jgi:FkbM family methyltransferase